MNDLTEIKTDNALIIPEGASFEALFQRSDAVDGLLDRIEKEALAHAPDLTTAKGRKEIASVAYRVAQSKTLLDNAGKDANEAARKQINAVDTERRKIRERLDALKVKVRAPLDKWEADEAERVENIKAKIALMDASRAGHDATPEEISALIEEIKGLDAEWAEFADAAANAREHALSSLRVARDRAQKAQAEREELERLRRAEAERQEQERKAAEEKAEAERVAKAEEEKRLAAERAAQEAKETAEREAAAREAALQRQIEEAKAREEKAAQAERVRIAEEERKAKEAAARRAADKAHRAKIKGEIQHAISKVNPDDLVDALIDGLIPHVTVSL